MSQEIMSKLDQLVFQKTKPFCYGCYQEVKGTHCPMCGSDDLMRLLPGYGCEYGTHTFYKAVLSEIDAEECEYETDEDAFMESLNEIYGDTVKVGFLNVTTAWAIKTLDPLAFELAMDEELNSLIDDSQLVEIEGSHYWAEKLEKLLEEHLEKEESVICEETSEP